MPPTDLRSRVYGQVEARARAGRFDVAFRLLSRASGEPLRLPADLSVFFPAQDGRQDLMYKQDFGLERHAGAFRSARAAVLSAPLSPRGRDLLCGYLDLFLGRYRRAAGALARAAAAWPGEYWPQFLHACAVWLLGDKLRTRELLPDALAAVEKAVAADPGQVYAYVVRAGLRREMEDVPGRLEDALRVSRMAPDFVWARTELAEVLSEEGRYRPALREANLLLRKYPGEAWAWAQRARMRGISGYYKLALADFEEAVRRDPACGPLYAWRGETKRRLGLYEEALADQDRSIAMDPEYRLAYVWRGRIHLLQGRLSRAVADFSRALRLEPREMLARAWRAEAWWKLGEHGRAAEDYEAIFPAEPQSLWNARLRRGETQENYFMLDAQGGKRERAFFDDLEAGAAPSPRSAWARAFRGRCLAAAGELRGAVAELTRAVQLDGALAYAFAWRGEALRRLGAHRRALADLEQALRLDPGHLWSWARRGAALAALGRGEEALGCFARLARTREQRYALAHVWHGETLWRLGRAEAARAQFRRAFLLDGKCKPARAWLEKAAAAA